MTGEFDAAAGILPRAEVALLGVGVCSVDGVDRTEDGVEVRMTIGGDTKIPADSTARIFRKSAVGEPYIDFEPPEGYDGGGPLLSRTVIDATTTPARQAGLETLLEDGPFAPAAAGDLDDLVDPAPDDGRARCGGAVCL